MGKLVIEINTAGSTVIGEPLAFLADVLMQIGMTLPHLGQAAIPAEPKQHPSYIESKGVALVFEASNEGGADPMEAKVGLRMGFVSDAFDTDQWRELKQNPRNVAVIKDGKLVG